MDKYKFLSEVLNVLVAEIRKKGKGEEYSKKLIENALKEMEILTQKVKGEIQTSFEALREEIKAFFKDKRDLEEVLKKCVDFKNDLWEL